MEQEMRTIWARIGMAMCLTPEEANIMLSDCTPNPERVAIVRRIFDEGRIRPEGDCYIPGCIIDDYNAEHETQYALREYAGSADDVDWDMNW